MATGCGCGTACSCYMVDGIGINVSGDGGVRKPWKPDLAIGTGDLTPCVQVMNCVGSNLADPSGLVYDPDTHDLSIGLSTLPDNTATFDPDGNLYVPSGAVPPTDRCVKTVDGLPDWVAGGALGVGHLNSPWGTVRSYMRAVDTYLDVTSLTPYMLRDGTLVIAPYAAFNTTWIADPAGVTMTYTLLTDAAWKSIKMEYVNWRGEIGEINGTDQGADTFPDALRVLGGRCVMAISVDGQPNTAANWRERLRARIVQEVTGRCLTDSAIIYSANLDTLSEARTAGIATGCWVDQNSIAENTPEAITAAGATWVIAVMGPRQNSSILSVAEMQPYAAAGLNVLCYGMMTRRGSNAAKAAGARGILSYDPIYTVNDQVRYAPLRDDEWTFLGRSPGQEPWRSVNNGAFTGSNISGQRGSDGASWQMQRDSAYTLSSTVLGQFSPLPNQDNYTITFGMQYTTTPPTNGYIGFAFAAPTDNPVIYWSDGDPSGTTVGVDPNFSGYIYRFYANGALYLTRYDGGASTTLQTTSHTAPVVGTWYAFTVTVTPTSVSVAKAGGPTVAADDTTYRGDYIHVLKFQASTPFDCTFRNLRIRVPAG